MSALAEGSGWRARLDLRFKSAADRTVLAHRRHQGPLLVQRALYPETQAAGREQPCHVYIVHPPGGIASGDDLELDVEVEAGAHALLTTPAAGKFYRRGTKGCARARQVFRVDDASLEWLPQENIFFPDAEATLSSRVELVHGARFIGWEIGCLGLPANKLTLGEGLVRMRFELYRDGEPVVLESLRLDLDNLSSRWGLSGFPVFGTFLASPAGPSDLDTIRAALESDCNELLLACTLVDGVLGCRGLAERADRLRTAFVRAWQSLRPPLLGCEAVLPRIWAT